jgi:hypothetical protein
MLVERVNRYINKGLKIMTNEQESIQVALEAILLLIYAWNSCPIPRTDISHSLVAVGRKFAFPIDYSSRKHWELVSSPRTVRTYSKDLAVHLTACQEVAELLTSSRNIGLTTANLSMPTGQTLGSTWLAILCLHIKLFSQTHAKDVLTSSSIDLGRMANLKPVDKQDKELVKLKLQVLA